MEDESTAPVIAMVRISEDRTSHDYYHARWTGSEWKKTFLANGGGHFHQTDALELCYSGGMAIDVTDTNSVYCSVPVEGDYGKIYEIIKYTILSDGSVTNTSFTKNSIKNNVRPYSIPNTQNANLKLVWMHGDYYDWIVSKDRPLGYPTAIHCDYELPRSPVQLHEGLLVHDTFDGSVLISTSDTKYVVVEDVEEEEEEFSICLSLYINGSSYFGKIVEFGGIIMELDETTMKPVITIGGVKHYSSNTLGNSDSWKTENRGTGGNWPNPVKLSLFSLIVTYSDGVLTTYIDGLIDQYIEVPELTLEDVKVGGFEGVVSEVRIYTRALNQDEVVSISDGCECE
jgi:hypothetical protein